MLPDRVSNPGPLTYESGALPIALHGPAPVRPTPGTPSPVKPTPVTAEVSTYASRFFGRSTMNKIMPLIDCLKQSVLKDSVSMIQTDCRVNGHIVSRYLASKLEPLMSAFLWRGNLFIVPGSYFILTLGT